jgi:ElaB/YqjD/DUF883 family membrane-anchored ribosome-binding protein
METHFDKLEEANRYASRERVLEDLKALSRDAEGLLKVIASDASEKGKALRQRLAGALDRAKTTTIELQKQAAAAARVAAKNTDIAIREHPYQAMGIAFGVGVLIGVLVARK